jgi:hypothetical protein
VDEDRRHWLERVAEAAQHAADDLRSHDDPAHRDLIEDLVRLHDSVTAQLEAETP